MRRTATLTCLTLGLLAGMANTFTVRAEDKRSADQIIKEIDAVKMPEPPSAEQRKDREVVLKFITQRQAAMRKQADLIGELYKVDPRNAKLTELLPERWQALLQNGRKTDELKAEIHDVAAHASDAKLRADAAFWGAAVEYDPRGGDMASFKKAVDAFLKQAPQDPRGAELLQVTANQEDDSAKQLAIYKRILKDYPDSQAAGMVKGNMKRLESVGKPFDLEFTDAIKGTEISMKSLKGKIVVVDFWATWCGPCVSEMPNMKKLYADYKDKGVEFIGVSLDQPKDKGGFDKLKEFVATNEIGWPQYYQGKGWESDFSRSWGINSIPAVFVVDADGKLYSVEARGKLDKLIPELLKKAKPGSTPGAGGE